MKLRIAFAKCITLIVALQILNISIYAQDINWLQQKQTLSYHNEINTIAEYIGEVILKHHNQFPEYPNDGHKDFQFSKHIDLKDFSLQPFKPKAAMPLNKDFIFPYKIDYSFLFFKEINPPPPKA
ncbi:hypothetical protein [Parafilimonas sp.]|uniref:hypothetical protein n=1 Tax=Parafilimonas sp. TaxID=1969739 RepID=UPI003F7F5DFA